MEGKRFIAHDFIANDPILIDRQRMTLSLYCTNMYGQINNLRMPQTYVVDSRKISGLIRRSNNIGYNQRTAKVIDRYIYAYLMTPEQKDACHRISDCPAPIVVTDDYIEAITKICEWAYELEYYLKAEEKESKRSELLQYYKDYLQQIAEVPPNHTAPSQPGGGKIMPRKRSAPQREAR